MKNELLYFITYVILNVISFTASTQFSNIDVQFQSLDYYVYYIDVRSLDKYILNIQETKLIVCSNIKFNNKESIGINEYQLDDGFSCLFKLLSEGLFKINLKLSYIGDLRSKDTNIKLQIGDTIINNELDLNKDDEEIVFVRYMKSGVLWYLSKENYRKCIDKMNKCNFEKVKFESSSNKNLLKFITFDFHFMNPEELINSRRSITNPKRNTKIINNKENISQFLLQRKL